MRVPYAEWNQIFNETDSQSVSKKGGFRGDRIFVTEEGYLLLVKPMTELLIVNKGGTPYEQGTWAHPQAALKFAAWLGT